MEISYLDLNFSRESFQCLIYYIAHLKMHSSSFSYSAKKISSIPPHKSFRVYFRLMFKKWSVNYDIENCN